MVEHIWESTEIGCAAEYLGKKTKSCKFKFLENGNAVGTVEAKLSGVVTKQWRGKYKVRACKDDELSYPLTCKVEIDGAERTDLEREVLVFAKTMTVSAADHATAAAIPNADFEITQLPPPNKGSNKTSIKTRRTDTTGKLTFDLVYPNVVKIAWKRPWILSSWKDETGRKPQGKLEYGFVAKLLFPDPTVAPDPDPRPDPKAPKEHLQYVNLERTDLKPGNGSNIQIRVGAKEPTKAAAGDRVWLVATFSDKNSKRDLAKDGCAPGTVVRRQATLDAKKEAVFELELGQAGGDRVVVKVGGTADAADDEVAVVNWRRLYYDICAADTMALEDTTLADGTTGKGMPAATVAWYTERLADVFVLYQPRRSKVLSAAAEPIKSCMMPATYLGASGADRYVVGGGDAKPSDWGYYIFTGLRMTLCDRAFSADGNATPHGESFLMEKAKDYFPVFDTHKEYCFERDMSWRGGDAITPLTWKAVIDPTAYPGGHPGLTAEGVPKSGSAERSWFKGNNMAWLEVALPTTISFVGPLSDTKCPVQVNFKLRTAYEINGSAGGGEQLMVLKVAKPLAMACTVCHELGHSMGMTAYASGVYKKKPPSGLEFPKPVPDGTAYVGKGHTGSHCAEALSAEDRKAASFQGKAGTCILFGEGGDEPVTRDRFCATCIEQARARRVQDIVSRWDKRKKSEL